jgi:hypothetical protein
LRHIGSTPESVSQCDLPTKISELSRDIRAPLLPHWEYSQSKAKAGAKARGEILNRFFISRIFLKDCRQSDCLHDNEEEKIAKGKKLVKVCD